MSAGTSVTTAKRRTSLLLPTLQQMVQHEDRIKLRKIYDSNRNLLSAESAEEMELLEDEEPTQQVHSVADSAYWYLLTHYKKRRNYQRKLKYLITTGSSESWKKGKALLL